MIDDDTVDVALDEKTDSNLIWYLADSMFDLTLENIPEAARQQSGWCLLDTLGCMVAGENHPYANAFKEGEENLFANEGLGRMIGDARQWAFQGDIFELNDLVGGHASIGAVSAILSYGLHKPSVTISDLLLSIAIAVETTTRLFEAHSWQKKPYADSGFVGTSILSAIGVAAGLGKLERLPRQQYREALAIAVALAEWGPSEVIFGQGGTIKPAQFGAGPAEVGHRAVAMAKTGITGPPQILDSPMGFFSAIATGYDIDLVLGGSGWRMEQAQRKLHACCGYIHSSLEALQDLRNQGHDLSQAKTITVEIPPAVFEAVAKEQHPQSENDARFHLRYMTGLVVSGADEYPIQTRHSTGYQEYLEHPHVIDAMKKVRLEILAEVPQQEGNRFNSSRIRADFGPGQTIATATCNSPRGTFRNPLTAEDLADKFRNLSAGTISNPQIERLIQGFITQSDLGGIEQQLLQDLREVLRELSGAQ